MSRAVNRTTEISSVGHFSSHGGPPSWRRNAAYEGAWGTSPMHLGWKSSAIRMTHRSASLVARVEPKIRLMIVRNEPAGCQTWVRNCYFDKASDVRVDPPEGWWRSVRQEPTSPTALWAFD